MAREAVRLARRLTAALSAPLEVEDTTVSVGAVFALFKSKDYKGLIPPYVVLTRPQGRFSEEGFLGPRLKP